MPDTQSIPDSDPQAPAEQHSPGPGVRESALRVDDSSSGIHSADDGNVPPDLIKLVQDLSDAISVVQTVRYALRANVEESAIRYYAVTKTLEHGLRMLDDAYLGMEAAVGQADDADPDASGGAPQPGAKTSIPPISVRIARLLRARRLAAGLSTEEVSTQLEVAPALYREMETGRDITPATMWRWCEVLGTTPVEVLRLAEE